MREMWLRKSARQGAASEGAEWEVVAMVRAVVVRVRERSARRRVGAMVAACWDWVVVQGCICYYFVSVIVREKQPRV
jgi:uncharacterized membrane protein